MKKILIVNGSGGVGKDTFVNLLAKYIPVHHDSIVNPIKEIAETLGWTGEKSEKDRKFLSDLKILADEYSDYTYTIAKLTMEMFLNDEITGEILCIDMREASQIERAKNEFGAKTVLITRDSVPHITSNIADKGVFDVKYDFYITNDGSVEDLEKKAKEFAENLIATPGYTKVVYISHPFSGKEENIREVEEIIKGFSVAYPDYLFLSPIHCFGHQYNYLDYEKGLKECLWLLSKADEMWIFGDYTKSKGCLREVKFCTEHNIPIGNFIH